MPPGLADLPRIGLRIAVAEEAPSVRWFGTGPWETYPDRRTAPTGWHELPVADLAVPYVRPQENGGRAGVREVLLGDPATGLHLGFAPPVMMTAGGSDGLELVVDAQHRGLGSASCGPNALPPYRIASGTHTWSWTVTRGHGGAR